MFLPAEVQGMQRILRRIEHSFLVDAGMSGKQLEALMGNIGREAKDLLGYL